MWIYIAHIVKLTSNALVTLVLTEQDCFEKLFETVNVTRQISEFIWQRVPDRRTSNWKSATIVRVGSTARYNEHTKTRIGVNVLQSRTSQCALLLAQTVEKSCKRLHNMLPLDQPCFPVVICNHGNWHFLFYIVACDLILPENCWEIYTRFS